MIDTANSSQPRPCSDPLSRMFIWWNQAFKTPGAYTEQAFREHLTEDAVLILNGQERVRGVAAWASHFQRIQATAAETQLVAEIVVPFEEVFQQGDKIYTYHVERCCEQGRVVRTLLAGHATLRDGKIALLVLVRADSRGA